MSIEKSDDRGMTRDEVAHLLGVHPLTVERRKDIPSYKIGRARRYLRSDVLAYIRGLQEREALARAAKPGNQHPIAA